MKIISFNINNDYRNIQENAVKIKNMIKSETPDIIGLQEITSPMYDELLPFLLNLKYNVSSKSSRSYFNMMISKFSDTIIEIPFSTTSMSRSFLKQYVKDLDETFITTHLESIGLNKLIREKQCLEICEVVSLSTYFTVFGDTNFSQEDEDMGGGLTYIDPALKTVFTYDSQLNNNAQTPFRSNLDRFYTNKSIDSKVDILINITFSDHFPIILTRS